jgi:hypothetical protein
MAAQLAAEEHVVDDVEVVAESEILVHDLDAQSGHVAGSVHGHGLPVVEVVTAVAAVDARDHLDQRGLAGTVVADERCHLAGIDGEVDVVEDVDDAEALVDLPHLQQWGRWCRGRLLAVLAHDSLTPKVAQAARSGRTNVVRNNELGHPRLVPPGARVPLSR